MIAHNCDGEVGMETFILKPNQSISVRNASLLLASIGGFSIFIGSAFAYIGAWIVLPFSGLEWLGLVYCFYLQFRASRRTEIIKLQNDTVTVETVASDQKKIERIYKKAWLKVSLKSSQENGMRSKVLLSSHGRVTEIGCFLADGEKRLLSQLINNSLKTIYQ